MLFLLALILSLAVFAADAAPIRGGEGTTPQAAPAARSLLVVPDGTGHAVVWQSAERPGPVVLRITSHPVRSASVTPWPGSPVLFASWEEPAPEGTESWVALTRDGGANWTPARRMTWEIPLRAGLLQPGVLAPDIPAELESDASGDLQIVQFRTVSLSFWLERLAALGATPLAPLPEHAWIVRMPPASAAAVAAESFVRWVGPYHPGYRVDPGILAALFPGQVAAPAGSSPGDAEMASVLEGNGPYLLQTFTPGSKEKTLLAEDVRAAGGSVTRMGAHGYLLEARLTPAQLLRVIRSTHLIWIEPVRGSGNDMNIVRADSGADAIESLAGYDGTGVTGEVFDDGIQNTPFHQDHDGIQIHGPLPDIQPHGTSTYGIVFGNGDRDGDGNPLATGMLPAAFGWFADYGFLTDRYQHTADLVTSPIYALFQSNSWGGTQTLDYTAISAEMDDIIWTYDIPIFQSQSNLGNRFSRPQAWAKNIISIGAVNHYDTATTADDCWCNDASIGPAADGRIKPDLLYWNDFLYTTTTTPVDPLYTLTFGGTSGATPIAAGACGLLLEMWADNIYGNNPPGVTVFDKRPHSATTKALLINTAEQYPFSGLLHDKTRVHQGWGRPSVIHAYDRAPLTKIVDESDLIQELDTAVYTAAVPAGQTELKITMVYQDRAGLPLSLVHRVNDVTLKVTDPIGTVYWGNYGLDAGVSSLPAGTADHLNTVENVFIPSPMAGDWTVEVIAEEINEDVHAETPEVDQDFALVVWPATSLVNCATTVPAPTGVTATPVTGVDNAIAVGWSGTGTATGYRVLRSEGGCGGPYVEVGSVPAGQTSFTDTTVSGGSVYGYVVRSQEACESFNSNCAETTAVGPCAIPPSFAGVQSVTSSDAASCGLDLSWTASSPAGTPTCAGPILYNVYRSTTSGFTPDPTNRVATCLNTLTWHDANALTEGITYHYIVRAEDSGGSGGACGGIEETNLVTASAAPSGATLTLASWDFESGLDGWTPAKGTPAAITGDFLSGDPNGTFNGVDPAQPEDDHTPAPGTRCLYTAENTAFNITINDVDGGEVMAASPIFDASTFSNLRISLWRWHYNRDLGVDASDYFAIDLSSDGGSVWSNLETLDQNVRANAWAEVVFNIPGTSLTSTMAIRVRSADGPVSSNIIESAIDDVLIEGGSVCTTATGPPGVIVGAPVALQAALTGGMVRLTWGNDCGFTPLAGVYRGDLATGYASIAPVPGLCAVSGGTVDLAPGSGSEFYLVAPNDGAVEGSLGTDSAGALRAVPASVCYPRAAPLNACVP